MKNHLKISEKTKIDGEKEALEILMDVQSSLNRNEQIAFFFFFVKNGEIFHLEKTNFFIKTLLLSNKTLLREIVDFYQDPKIDFDLVDEKILEIWNEYIKGNLGTCATYFGSIAVNLIKQYLENTKLYDELKRESHISFKDKILNKDHIDIVGRSKGKCDVYECKHSIDSQKDKIPIQMDKLRKTSAALLSLGYKSEFYLSTIEFMEKENILLYDSDLSIENIINGEDVFKTPIKV